MSSDVSLYWLKIRVLAGEAQKMRWEGWCEKVKVRAKRGGKDEKKKRGKEKWEENQ